MQLNTLLNDKFALAVTFPLFLSFIPLTSNFTRPFQDPIRIGLLD